MKAPFPYFGGKSTVANEVWRAFRSVNNYVEPFFGSGAILLSRPNPQGTETVNDADGLLSNFWRAVKYAPKETAEYAAWPVNENDLHARHLWLVNQRASLSARLEGDPEYFDTKAAGWWVWGISAWIGAGWCSGNGPWRVVDGVMVKTGESGGIHKQIPNIGDAGQGIHKKRPHISRSGQGIHKKRPHIGHSGQGIHKQRPHCAAQDAGLGVHRISQHGKILSMFQELSNRLSRVRVCSGDWRRIMGESVTIGNGMTAIFFDPPYADTAGRSEALYSVDSKTVAHDVREWCIANGNNPKLRIALCGYEGEHVMPDNWRVHAWSANGGYANQGNTTGKTNAKKERIWFSPACITNETLF